MDDAPVGPDLSHPDAMIRLASAVHKFRCPEIAPDKKLSFVKSFKTCGQAPMTKALMKKADASRGALAEALVGAKASSTVSGKSVVRAAKTYIPQIHQILLTCKVQPEVARLDERLSFEWSSGLEHKAKNYKSEAIMYELVMSIACEALGEASTACEESIDGDFPAAGRGFKRAAGILQFLADDQLPKWISRGSNVDDKELPAEVSIGVCDAFKTLFLAVGQQMAIATVLVKPETPNYGLLAKLSLGVAENLDVFMNIIRGKAAEQKERLSPNFFALITFQVALQRALSNYFLARATWDKKDSFGLAIAIMNEAVTGIRQRDTPTGRGMPAIDKKSPLFALNNDLKTLRQHMATVLAAWEKDNSSVYFDRVPSAVPEKARLSTGVMMMKPEEYKLEDVEPALLSLPGSGSVEAPSVLSRLFGGNKGGKDNDEQQPPPSSMPPPPPPSYDRIGPAIAHANPHPPPYPNAYTNHHLPQARAAAPPSPYAHLPQARPAQPPAPSYDHVFGGGGGGMSDEELARQLQERFNRGEE